MFGNVLSGGMDYHTAQVLSIALVGKPMLPIASRQRKALPN
jgi:hypothetical protein